MGNELPLVTIAVLAYEQGETLKACLASVLRQDYPNLELLVCDDGSPSFQADAVEAFLRGRMRGNIRAYRIQSHPRNLGTVRNCGWALAHANGALLKFLAADDRLYDAAVIGDLVAVFREDSVQVVAGRGQAPGKLLPSDMEFIRLRAADSNGLYALLCSRPWSSILAPAVMFRTSCLRGLGGFDESYRYLEDWPLWLRMSRAGIPVRMIPRIVVTYSARGISSCGRASDYASPLRMQYLQECRRALRAEQAQLARDGKKRLYLQCVLSERILLHREWQLDSSDSGAFFWRPIDFAALFYQKALGGIANQKTVPAAWPALLLAAGTIFAGRSRLGNLCLCMGCACVLWNAFLWDLGRRIKRKIRG